MHIRGGGSPDYEVNNMTTVEQVKKAFHKARIEGEQLLSEGRISWEDYAFVMVGYETELRNAGEEL